MFRLLLLTLLIIGSVQAASAQTNAPRHLLSKKLIGAPKPSRAKLISRSGSTTVDSERAIYSVTLRNGRQTTVGLEVFRDDQTKQLWVGKEQDLYVSTEHGLIGLKVLPGAIFDSRGMLKIEDESSLTNLSDIWRIVDETITPEMLVDFHPPLDFHGALDDTFLLLSPTSSAPGRPRVNKVSVLHKGEIQLDISSPGGDYNAIATFDDQTLNLKKLILDGKQVFPK